MKIERIQCLVRLNQKDRTDLTQIVMAGPSALPATEIPLLREKHDVADGLVEEECCISMAKVVGEFETTKQQEFERLKLKYGEELVRRMYPQGRMMPATLEEVDLPPGCALPVPRKSRKKSEVIEEDPSLAEMRAILEDNGVKVPKGNLSREDLETIMIQEGLAEPAE